MDGEHAEALKAVAAREFEERARLIGGEGSYFLLVDLRRTHGLGRVARHAPPPECLLERPVQDDVDLDTGVLRVRGTKTARSRRTVKLSQTALEALRGA